MDATEAGPSAANLVVRGLSKRYGQVVVADGVDLTAVCGACLGIIGPNGAGKTSLFNLLDGSVRPDSGEVCLDGHNITAKRHTERARLGIARAYQVPKPFPALSVFENVLVAATFGAKLRGEAAGLAALHTIKQVGLADRSNTLAGSLTLLNRKRLELAKALAAKPKILLLDEIAGGLTEPEVKVLVELIRSLKPLVAMIWIEHVAHALTAVADSLMVLHFGRKLMEGPVAETLASSAVKEIYLGIKADVAP